MCPGLPVAHRPQRLAGLADHDYFDSAARGTTANIERCWSFGSSRGTPAARRPRGRRSLRMSTTTWRLGQGLRGGDLQAMAGARAGVPALASRAGRYRLRSRRGAAGAGATRFVWVANMVGQRGIRRGRRGPAPVRYEAIQQCLGALADHAVEPEGLGAHATDRLWPGRRQVGAHRADGGGRPVRPRCLHHRLRLRLSPKTGQAPTRGLATVQARTTRKPATHVGAATRTRPQIAQGHNQRKAATVQDRNLQAALVQGRDPCKPQLVQGRDPSGCDRWAPPHLAAMTLPARP